jgi:8-oxo-dGTP pyrophosphatase MutT (NUDIX family)
VSVTDATEPPLAGEWQILKSDEIYRSPFFVLRRDTCALPDARIMPAYYVWQFVDWVNVVALTTSGQFILVDQYRHAAQQRFLEFPGGTTEPGAEEAPEHAARRELLEETGYAPGNFHYLGLHYPNPGLQTNRMHVYLATECERIAEQRLDTYEDIEVELIGVARFLRLIEQGKPMNSLMMASLTLALPAIRKLHPTFVTAS